MTRGGYGGRVIRVALAGGIGSGKSAAAAYLRDRGFAVVDADVVAREVVRPGEPAWRALVDAFGAAVLDADGAIDRAFLARVVFTDASARRRVEAITHPRIGEALARHLDAATGDVAFVALPLFRPEHRALLRLDAAWALEVSPATALARLEGERGMSDEDARSRIAAQMTNEERRAIVDRVIVNEGTLEDLHRALDAALEDLTVSGRA